MSSPMEICRCLRDGSATPRSCSHNCVCPEDETFEEERFGPTDEAPLSDVNIAHYITAARENASREKTQMLSNNSESCHVLKRCNGKANVVCHCQCQPFLFCLACSQGPSRVARDASTTKILPAISGSKSKKDRSLPHHP